MKTADGTLPHRWVTIMGRTWCLECGDSGGSVAPCERSPYGKEGVQRRKDEISRAEASGAKR